MARTYVEIRAKRTRIGRPDCRPRHLLGVHGPSEQPIWWDEHLPAWGFLEAIRNVAPGVLEFLRDAALHASDDGTRDRAVLTWARRFRLHTAWIIDAAHATVARMEADAASGVSPALRWDRPRDVQPMDVPTHYRVLRDKMLEVTIVTDPKHLDWIARWQVLSESPERIDPERPERVRRMVKRISEVLFLPARPAGRPGRPRKSPHPNRSA
jgi:hypothetical protein